MSLSVNEQTERLFVVIRDHADGTCVGSSPRTDTVGDEVVTIPVETADLAPGRFVVEVALNLDGGSTAYTVIDPLEFYVLSASFGPEQSIECLTDLPLSTFTVLGPT